MEESQVRDLVMGLRDAGHDVGLRDAAYALLARTMGASRHLGYRAIFGDNPEVAFDLYEKEERVIRMRDEVERLLESLPAESRGDTVSFDELKQGLIDDMHALEELRDSRNPETGAPLLDAKEMAQVVARIADIRVKLTEKFGTTERIIEQRVVVNAKFNAICPHCGHEVSAPPSEQTNQTLFTE